MSLFKLLRPLQWTKNLLCLAGVVFSGLWYDISAIQLVIMTTIIFSVGSSSIYIFNDILDLERDQQHPIKRKRPIASGMVRVPMAVGFGIVLAIGALTGAFILDISTLVCLVLYMANNVAYSTYLKHLALFDVLCIAFGFVIRLLAGIYILGDTPTAWIVLCTFFLAIFLGFSKRRAELFGLLENDSSQRPVLSKYTAQYLDFLINSSATIALLCYSLFTVLSGKNPTLLITIPIVWYGIMHYKRLVMILKAGEEPEKILLKDNHIKICILFWLITYLTILHWDLRLFR